MRFLHHSKFVIVLTSSALIAFSLGCGGSGSSTPAGTGVPTSLTVAPSSLSLNPGQVVQVTPTLFDGAGNALSNTTFTFSATGGAQVSTNGLVCAGTWDSLTAPVVCTPSTATTGSVVVTSQGISGTV